MKTNKSIFKSESTQKAFDNWAKWLVGITYEEADNANFYAFVEEYFNNHEKISKEKFVKLCKEKTPVLPGNRGICQEYYKRLNNIIAFLKWKQKQEA